MTVVGVVVCVTVVGVVVCVTGVGVVVCVSVVAVVVCGVVCDVEGVEDVVVGVVRCGLSKHVTVTIGGPGNCNKM